MSTAAQQNANRANSESSTGPVTEAGKKASSQNALKHGLACGRVYIDGEDPEEFRSLKRDLRQEHRPEGITEDLLVEKMALSLWFSRRAVICQAHAFETASADKPIPDNLGALLRYQTTNDRAFYKAFENLRAIQKERLKNAQVKRTADGIGFVQKASAEELWDFAVEQHKRQYPNEPFPDFSPEEKQKLIDSLR